MWHRLTDGIGAAEHAAALRNLSRAERDRAAKFAFERDRLTFAAAHDLLRTVLSQYADVAPAAWEFAPTAHGKPILAGAHSARPLRFNLSHTTGLVACAVSRDADVGIDVEAIRPADDRMDLGELASRFFSRTEAASLDVCEDEERRQRFVELWTLKEAYVKATGEGLSHPLDTFSFAISEPAAIHFAAPPGADAKAWQFGLFLPAPGYRMAVAARRRPGGVLRITARGQLPWSSPACILARFSP